MLKEIAKRKVKERDSEGNFLLYSLFGFISLILLIWSSLIDPKIFVPNTIGVFFIILSVELPAADFAVTYLRARKVTASLKEAQRALDSSVPEDMVAARNNIEARLWPKGRRS